jgi:hypothetical protein
MELENEKTGMGQDRLPIFSHAIDLLSKASFFEVLFVGIRVNH